VPVTSDAVFVADGPGRFLPSEHAGGPWDPGAMHGGAPAALLAREIERVDSPVPMMVSRLTIDLLRPVPLEPLQVHTRVVRPGRKVQWVEGIIEAEGVEIVRCIALRQRVAQVTLPEESGAGGPPSPPPPAMGSFRAETDRARTGFIASMDLRFVGGDFEGLGPATVWFRLTRDIVQGETPTPLMRVAAAADFGNGVSRVLDWDRWVFINPDLSIHLHRLPAGEWICLDARTEVQPSGVGLAESVLFDEHGVIARSLQSLLVDARR
jgi:hypothetical protein